MSNVMQWPSRPPVHPPGCDCGCQDSRSGLFECWEQMSQFEQMITEIVSKVLTNKASSPVPLPGVTDGSDAKPGQIGEFIRGVAQVNYAAYPAVTDTTASPLVVPPGDWDLFGIVTISTGVGIVEAYITTPVPPGISDDVYVQQNVPGQISAGQMPMNTVRGSFKVPTLIPFHIHVDQSSLASLPAGVISVILSARRVR